MALNINGGLTLTSGSLNTIQTPRTSVVYDSGLIFSASVDNVELLGNTFSVTSSIITLDTADATYNRVDAIVAELSSSVGPRITKVTGTPSAEAAFPVLDPSNQIALKYVTVKANAVTPSSAGTNPFDQETPEDFETVLVYNEGTNLPVEWITGSSPQWINDIPGNTYQSTEEAYVGSYSVKNNLNKAQTGGLRGQYIAPYFRYPIQDGNQIQAKRVAGISFYIKLKTKLTASQPKLIAQFNFNNLSGQGFSKSLGFNDSFQNFGIDINNTTDWQWVALSIDDFVSATNENPNNVLTSFFLGAKGGVSILPNDAFVYFDYIQLHLGSLPADDPNNGGTGGNGSGGTGVYKQGDTNFSIIPTNALSCVTNDFSTVGGGQNNTITGSQYSYIGAGQNNIIESGSDYISILGGAYNTASADYSSILGGYLNKNRGSFSSIAGGNSNCIGEQSNCSTIGGGSSNKTLGCTSGTAIGGGFCNTICGSTNSGHVIAGGTKNCACNTSAGGGHVSILGGCLNTGSGDFSSIAGGCSNTNQSDFGFIGGGAYNTASGDYSSVIGGQNNYVNHSDSFIIGSNLTSDKACYTFMNNLDVAGVVSGSTFSGSFVGDGSGLTGIPTSSIVNFPTEVSRSAAAAGFGSGGGVTELPVGGTTGQSLVKNSDTDYDVTWSTISGGGGNGEYVPYITGSSSSGILPRLGDNCTTIDNFATIAGGRFNNVVDAYSFIGGGFTNLVSQSYSAVLGGIYNEVHTLRSSIVGGCKNCIHTQGSVFIGGGTLNTGSGGCSVIVGGESNTNAATHGFIGGGDSNTITSAGRCGAILGGTGNCLCNSCSFIIGSNITSSADCTTFVNNLNVQGGLSITSLNVGSNATLGGEYSSILAGTSNGNDGKWSAVGGGNINDIANTATGSFLGAGYINRLDGNNSFLGAGYRNCIHAGTCENVIGAGRFNFIKQDHFHGILAGHGNTISSSNAAFINAGNTIVGGRSNQILQEVDGSFIGNGCNNVITGSFNFSSIIGGECNIVATTNSHIIGSNITSDKANYTYVENIHITGSTTTNGILQLTRRETTPTGVEGMIISSGSAGSSKLYYYDGSSWNALF